MVAAVDVMGDRDAFVHFVEEVEPQVRRALVARYGLEGGRDATAEAMIYAWRHRDRVMAMERPVGYLVRVGQSFGRRALSRKVEWSSAPAAEPSEFEPRLGAALAGLSMRQREAVVLCVGYGMTLAEASQTLGTSRSSVHRNLGRGLAALRAELGADVVDEVEE